MLRQNKTIIKENQKNDQKDSGTTFSELQQGLFYFTFFSLPPMESLSSLPNHGNVQQVEGPTPAL